MSWFKKLKEGLSKTTAPLTQGIKDVFVKKKLDEATLMELEDVLIMADMGVETAQHLIKVLSKKKVDKEVTDQEVREIFADEITQLLEPLAHPLIPSNKPHICLVIGVNGTGKTTTIAKLAHDYKSKGHKIMLAAADTFRAAAIDQLTTWGERVNVPVIARAPGADPASVSFEGFEAARRENTDILFIDTAGRLQNKANLMSELEKINRTLKKLDPEAPHEVILVLDATTGQNAVNQVEVFNSVIPLTGLVMTKLDGTAKGGIVVSLAQKFKLPILALGVGEGVDDLKPFEAADFARNLMGL